MQGLKVEMWQRVGNSADPFSKGAVGSMSWWLISCATEMNPQRKSALKPQKERGENYYECGKLLFEQLWCLG